MLRGNALTLCQVLRLASKLPRPSWAKSVMKMSLRLMSTDCRSGLLDDDAQRQQHRIGVGGLDGLGCRRAALGLEVDVAADEVDLVADALEQQDPLLVEVERVAAHAAAAGDGDGAETGLFNWSGRISA